MKLKCPACGERGISPVGKFFLGGFRSIRCSSCGRQSRFSGFSFWLVNLGTPIIGTLAGTAALALLLLAPDSLYFVLALVLFCGAALVPFLSPLSPKDKASE